MAFYIQNVNTGLLLDVLRSGKVILFKSHGGTNQQWTYKDGMIFTKHRDGFVLEVDEEMKEEQVQIGIMNGRPNQKWYFDDDGFVRNETGVFLDFKDEKLPDGSEKIPEPKVTFHQKHPGCKNQVFRRIYIR